MQVFIATNYINRFMKAFLLLLTSLVLGCAGGAAVYSYRLGEMEERVKGVEAARAEAEAKARVERSETSRMQVPPAPPRPPPAPPPPPLPAPPAIVGSVPPTIVAQTPKSQKSNTNHTTVVGQLYRANMAFGLPQKANIRDDIKAQLIIDVEKTAVELASKLEPGTVVDKGQIRVSRILKANLVAPDFKVDPVTPEEQPVAESGSTEWHWNLKPLSAGIHPVKLSVWAEVKIGPKSVQYSIHTYDRQVMVEVTAGQVVGSWWSKYWQWTFTTLIIPLVVWWWKSKSSKKDTTSTNRQ